jgi:cell division transport system permease protein
MKDGLSVTKSEGVISVKLRTTKFFVKEGLNNLRKNKTMSAASITSVIAALLVIGIFLIIVLNVDYGAAKLESQIEMMVYLQDGLSETLVASISKEINTISGVKDVQFIPKAQALKDLNKKWGDHSYLLEGLEGDNPLPDSLKVTLLDPAKANSVALAVSSISNIERVVYGKAELEKLLQVTYILRITSLVMITILVFISIFIISNTIKLTVYARRKEINIMKFVGAADWFVRGPFIVEGMLLGLLGSIITSAVLAMGYYYGSNAIMNQMIGLLSIRLMPFGEIFRSMTLLLGTVGLLIGGFGSFLSVRKFIRV